MKKSLMLCLFCLLCLTATAQLSLIKQFDPCCAVGQFEPMSGFILFNANGQLWRSDGTTNGTVLVSASVTLPTEPSLRCRIGNTIYFISSDGSLWKTDGTTAGTFQVKALGTVRGPLVNVNGLLVFGLEAAATGTELWRSDGTEAGTYMITDLLPGTGSGYAYTSPQAAVLDGFFYFQGPSAPTGVPNIGSRATLYRTNGTAAGTTRVTNGGFEPYGMNAQNGRLVYIAYQPTSFTCSGTTYTDLTKVLMKVESGVASIVKRPADVRPFGNSNCPLTPIGETFLNTSHFVNSGSYHYFRAQTEVVNGVNAYNIWRTDGTTAGTIPVTNYLSGSTEGPIGTAGSVWDAFSRSDFGFGSLAYFPVKSNTSGIELWRTDGTTAGTYLLRDINPSGDANPRVARTLNGITYFFATDPTNGTELWRTDGTTAGTLLVQDLNPGGGGQPGNNGVVLGGNFYFYGTNGNTPGLYSTCVSPTPTLSVLPSGTVCAGTSTTLSAAGCSGTVTWSTGATGSSLVVAPTTSTTYTATCSVSGCTSPASNAVPITVLTTMETIKAGNWNDPTVWSCGRVPTASDAVTLNHAVIVPASYVGNALRLRYSPSGRLLYQMGGRLRLGP